MEQFSCKTNLIIGNGAVAALAKIESKRLFMVTDPYFMKDGTAQRVAAMANADEVQYFDRVRPDPTVELAAKGTAELKRFGADTLVALGGGSAIDCAKAMHYFCGGDRQFVAIPTTSGSGSEVTDFAVLTHENGKYPLVDARLRPNTAILDGELLLALPPSVIADTGFDVLTHALEAAVANGAGAMTDMLSRDAFVTVYGALPASFAGSTDVRLKIHRAATMAGLAFTHSGLGLCHALSHSLGGIFHIPHGRLNAILLPGVVSCNAHVAGKKYADIARAAGLAGGSEAVAVRNLRGALIRLRRELKMPDTLCAAGADPQELSQRMPQIVQSVLSDPCCESNPVKADDFLIRRILEEVTGRA